MGLLVASYDDATGAHIFQTLPSGEYYEFHVLSTANTTNSTSLAIFFWGSSSSGDKVLPSFGQEEVQSTQYWVRLINAFVPG